VTACYNDAAVYFVIIAQRNPGPAREVAQQASLQRQRGKPHTDRRLQSLVAPDRFPLAVRAAPARRVALNCPAESTWRCRSCHALLPQPHCRRCTPQAGNSCAPACQSRTWWVHRPPTTLPGRALFCPSQLPASKCALHPLAAAAAAALIVLASERLRSGSECHNHIPLLLPPPSPPLPLAVLAG
jgi:hypothetical protein